MDLLQLEVTVRRFDPGPGPDELELVLPVDSPDAEPVVSSTMANAVASTLEVDHGRTLSVASRATGVRRRS